VNNLIKEKAVEDTYSEFCKKLETICDLLGASSLLGWDQQTHMPPGGAKIRADQKATINGLIQEITTSEEYKSLLEVLVSKLDQLDYDSNQAGVIRYWWRDYKMFNRIPSYKLKELSHASSMAFGIWREARENSDFNHFLPQLEKLVDLQHELINLVDGSAENPYDILVNWNEPGLTASDIEAVFSPLKPALIELVRAISTAEPVDESPVLAEFSEDGLLEMSRLMAENLGYSFEHGRLDLAPHPITFGTGFQDVRITTRMQPDYPMFTLIASIHEAGHAIHCQQFSPSLYRLTPYFASAAINESQARIYEMVIGRSEGFWSHFFPHMQKTFPHLQDTSPDHFYRAMNAVRPSMTRVKADPVTYGLHIILRFELENDIFNNRVALKDLPDAWNAKMEEYLGLTPANDAEGLLQDMHWTFKMGYFPTYLLGSIFAVQLWDKILEELPDTEEQMAKGNFAPVTAWLGNNVHQHGNKYTLHELAERAVGNKFSSEIFITYLKQKYGKIYGL
jgi:carboxypeptidase Taq